MGVIGSTYLYTELDLTFGDVMHGWLVQVPKPKIKVKKQEEEWDDEVGFRAA